MQFRDNNPGIENPLMWEFFGGTADEGEGPVAAAVREIKEELGIDVTEDELEEVAMHPMNGADEYLYKITRPVEWGEFVVNEGAGAAFLSRDELMKLEMCERARFFVEEYL